MTLNLSSCPFYYENLLRAKLSELRRAIQNSTDLDQSSEEEAYSLLSSGQETLRSRDKEAMIGLTALLANYLTWGSLRKWYKA